MQHPLYHIALCFCLGASLLLPAHAQEIRDLGSRLELFTDHYLIDKLDGTQLKLHEPKLADVAIQFDKPWEGPFCGYTTVIKHPAKPLYQMYYRGLPVARGDGSTNEAACYAESPDGIRWTKPNLRLHEVNGTRDNNCILHRAAPFSHNFSPFYDTRPGVPDDERYKALAGTSKTGLVPWASPDGIRWRKLRDEAVFRKGAFDSQNVAFWSEHEQCYVLYFRIFTGGTVDEKVWQPKGYRTVSRTTSKDFLNWSEPQRMSFGGTPPEHLYTNQTHPYFRAPHLYVALPMRFMPGRKVLTDAQATKLGVAKGYGSDCAEAVLMTSRGGTQYDRTFMEGFIRPGTDLGNWASRAGLTALGVVPTGPAEMSLYKQAHYTQPTAHLLRYTLRTDGFASLNAPYKGGEMTTKPLKFSGKQLVLNFSTSAAGSVRVEIQDAQGKPIPGFALADATETIGDDIERIVAWKNGSDVSKLAGQPVRLRFVMKDADVYSLRFR
ncbi:MAG: hypothetical protein AB1705_08860 [Verrucomicrobiota bacterium]